jgi:hypothetical protein
MIPSLYCYCHDVGYYYNITLGNLWRVWECSGSKKTGLAPAPLVERLFGWSWSRFEKRLAKRLQQLD